MTLLSYKASNFEKRMPIGTLTTGFDKPRGSPKSTILEVLGELFDIFCYTFCRHGFGEALGLDFQ